MLREIAHSVTSELLIQTNSLSPYELPTFYDEFYFLVSGLEIWLGWYLSVLNKIGLNMAKHGQWYNYHKAIIKIGWLHLYLTELKRNIIINGELYKLWENTHSPRMEEIINK